MSFAISFVDVAALWTRSACVPRIDNNHWYAAALRFICDKLTKLRKRPSMQACSLCFSGLNPLANMRQILNGNSKMGAFGTANNLLRDAVVYMFMKSSLLARQFLEFTFSGSSTSFLQAGSTLTEFGSKFFNIGTAIRTALTVECQVNDSNINTQNSVDTDFICVGDIADASHVPFIANKHDSNFATTIFKQFSLPIAADKRNLHPSGESPYGHAVSYHQTKYSIVVWLTTMFTKSSKLGLWSGFVGICHFGNTEDDGLRRKPKSFSAFSVRDFLKIKLSHFASLNGSRRQPIAGRITALKCTQKYLLLLRSWLKLDISHKFHSSIIEELPAIVNGRSAVQCALILAAFMLFPASAYAACNGQFTTGELCANPSGSTKDPSGTRLTTLFDLLYGSSAGTIIYRGPSGWTSLAGNNSGTQVLSENASGVPSWLATSGTGTVTSVGLTAPAIFTVSGSPVTTAGSLAFTAVNESANTFWAGPTSGGATTPGFRAIVIGDFPTIGGNTVIGNGTGSGAVPTALAMPSCSGAANALIWTSSTGFGCNSISTNLPTISADNVLANATGGSAAPTGVPLGSCSAAQNALTYNTTTHAFGCNTISGSGTVVAGTAGQLAYYGGSTNVVSGNADANISAGALTLGVGSSVLGQLILEGSSSGAVTLTPQAAAGTPTITFGTASGTPAVTASAPLAITSATGNIVITGATGKVLAGSGPAFTATPTIGVASTTTGALNFVGLTSGTVTLSVADIAGTWTMKLPTSAGSNGQFLETDGSGNASWANSSGSGTVDSGTAGQLAYYAGSGTTIDGNVNATVSAGALTLGVAASTIGQLKLAGNTSGTAVITPQATSGSPTLTLPNASGTFAVSASSPLALSATTGALTCATCVTGPGSTTSGHIATWNNSSGTLLADTTVPAVLASGLCSTSGAFPIYNSTGSTWQCSTVAGSFAHLGIPSSTAEPYDFWIARPSAVSGTILQMQDGKTGTLRTLTAGTTGVNFQSLVDTSSSGFSYSAISLDTQCQAGTGGACVGLNIFSQSNTNWTASGALAGTSAINTIGQSSKGGTAWGSNFVASCVTTACSGLYATELDVQNSIVGTSQASGIWLIAKNSVVPTAGSVALISSTVSNTGFPTAGLYFSTVAGFYPLTTAATIIKSDAGTVVHGIDFSAITCSTDCINVPGFVETSADVTINQNAAAIPASGNIPTNGVNLFSVDGSNAGYTAVSFGANPTNLFIRIDGTNASKTALLNGDIIGQVSGRGWDGSTISNTAAAIQMVAGASTNWSGSDHSANIIFRTTPGASTTIATAMEVFASGGVGLGASPADPGTGVFLLKKQTFSSLTGCGSTIEGAMASVTDSTTATWGATITGSGTNHVMAYCDGTSWTVSAK